MLISATAVPVADELERVTGFEPTTSCLRAADSHVREAEELHNDDHFSCSSLWDTRDFTLPRSIALTSTNRNQLTLHSRAAGVHLR